MGHRGRSIAPPPHPPVGALVLTLLHFMHYIFFSSCALTNTLSCEPSFCYIPLFHSLGTLSGYCNRTAEKQECRIHHDQGMTIDSPLPDFFNSEATAVFTMYVYLEEGGRGDINIFRIAEKSERGCSLSIPELRVIHAVKLFVKTPTVHHFRFFNG